MALNQFFRLTTLILLSSCSNETNKSDTDYQEEFNSITFAFENSSILDFNAQQDIDGEFYVIEINTVPGMTSHSCVPKSGSFLGMSYNEVVEKIIDASF